MKEDARECNWSFTLPIGVIILVTATTVGFVIGNFVGIGDLKDLLRTHTSQTSNDEVSYLYAVGMHSSTLWEYHSTARVCTLTAPSAQTHAVRFTDRPITRMSQMSNTDLVTLWSAGNTFAVVPPNAAINDGTSSNPFTIVVLHNASMHDDNLVFTMKDPAEGDITSYCVQGNSASLSIFIDSAAVCTDPSGNPMNVGQESTYDPSTSDNTCCCSAQQRRDGHGENALCCCPSNNGC